MTTGRPAPSLDHLVPVPTYRGQPSTRSADVTGRDLFGRSASIAVTAPGSATLLLFLSSSCQGCRPLWEAAAEPGHWGLPRDAGVVVVTRAGDHEDVEALRGLALPGAVVVMSDDAWRAYRVQGAPFFSLVVGRHPLVVTEGVAWGVAQVAADVGRALGPRGV